jgi:uncharacterized repeat protein (TIGR03803 family)
MKKLRRWKIVAVLAICAATAIASPAQTFTTLYSFAGTDGSNPLYVSLVQGTDGQFYGTTSNDGANNSGTAFKITPGGTLTTLYNFCVLANCFDGTTPYAGLIQGSDGNFYGTTYGGGTNYYYGTVFQLTPSGGINTLHSFDFTDGENPYVGLIQASNGTFYGTTASGGKGSGTVFSITAEGAFATVYSFCSVGDCLDGGSPYGGLIQASNGNFYGTTSGGGEGRGGGTVFELTPSGTLTTLYSFCPQSGCVDGLEPRSSLIQATDGNFYGTTVEGGTTNQGTIFKITPTGTMMQLYSFCASGICTDGSIPYAGLIQATDGNFYGTTSTGGTSGDGTIFEITAAGKLTTLHNFDIKDGDYPTGGLVQGTDGNFYGTTNKYGANFNGTVFSLAMGLAPFVTLTPNSGIVHNTIGIFGQGFTGTTSVSFNGAAAKFTVKSDAYITATVPVNATTGPVTVTTPGGKLSSNQPFHILATVSARP